MKLSRVLLSLMTIVFFASILLADGPVGVYAMVQKVVFEPSEAAPKTLEPP